MAEAYAQFGSAVRWLPSIVLLWLAVAFGRTLFGGATPLIERICRIAVPAPSARLCRYTRGLTAVWCAYFVAAAVVAGATLGAAGSSYGRVGLAVWCGTALLFAGEWWWRRRVFPDDVFPGLVQQVRDTWSVWRIGRRGSRSGSQSHSR